MPDQERMYISADELCDRIRAYQPDADVDIVRKAYAFTEKAHEGQFRKSGEPYFSHPCAVAEILCTLKLDPVTIAAGLLHDCVEDNEDITTETIMDNFGQDVALLVDGVTKLKKMDFSTREAMQAESLRKMILAMAKDIRVVMIKLADRLHNMRTLKFQRKERQVPIARETLDIYAPLAHRLGLSTIKWELEDLSLRYIDPEGFYQLVEKVGMKREEREAWVQEIIAKLKNRLEEVGIHNTDIEGRPKHLYSIYRKMKTQHKTFEQINDLIAVRVLVNTTAECYSVLGEVHLLWTQMAGRFKDYISVPKSNMYQSLHTTVIDNGRPFEVQIRTYEMHATAEYGIAAHWRYKEGRPADNLDQKLSWLRRILDWQKDIRDPNEFGEMLKTDLFADEVLVFTPKGEVISLPKGATPLDFAYRIHSAVGNKCVGAKVNNHIVPLGHQLETGDFVEIMTSSASKGPSNDWIKMVKTSEAKAKIRAFLKSVGKEENIIRGKDMLEKEAHRLDYSISQLMKNEYLERIYKKYSINNLNDLYAAVGFGSLSTAQVLNRLIEEYKKDAKNNVAAPVVEMRNPSKQVNSAQEYHEHVGEVKRQQAPSSSNGVIVKGMTGMLTRFARCCNPLPGDDIVGYISRGRGVTVHRSDCINMKESAIEPQRLIEVAWEGQNSDGYSANIQIVAHDRNGLLAAISTKISNMDVPILSCTTHTDRRRISMLNFVVQVKNTQQLELLIDVLNRQPGVDEVYRVFQ